MRRGKSGQQRQDREVEKRKFAGTSLFSQEILSLLALIVFGLNLSLHLEIKRWLPTRARPNNAPAKVVKRPPVNVMKPPVVETPVEKERIKVDTQLPQFYGQHNVILGEETCPKYRNDVPFNSRRWAPAGMFNCGTNTLHRLLRANCITSNSGRHAFWQAPWGKHNPLSWRGKHWSPQFAPPNWRPEIDTVFPIMVIKDPLTWMKSMCRNHYEAYFKRVPSHRDNDRCPSPVNFTRTLMKYQPTIHSEYTSLIHFWAQWNHEYWNTSLPHLIIRFEDLLFDSEKIVSRVCSCLGGRMRDTFQQAEEPTKSIREGHRGPINDRSKALSLYGSESERYAKYTHDDLRYISMVLQQEAPSFLDDFQYSFSSKFSF